MTSHAYQDLQNARNCQICHLLLRKVKNQVTSPLASLVPTAPTAHGGPKGKPADDESHHQMSRRFTLSAIVLTGLSFGKHKFSLEYPIEDQVMRCIAVCQCGFRVEISHFRSYGGVKDLQMKWEQHIGTWKGWI